jgi:hypothetical protein
METRVTRDSSENVKGESITMLGRVLAAAAAMVCCFLLYRFAKAYYSYRGLPISHRKRNQRRRPFFGVRKDVLYSALSNGSHEYQDDDDEGEGYHDDILNEGVRDSVHLNGSPLDRPLPELPGAKQDKPLPPLPLPDLEPE